LQISQILSYLTKHPDGGSISEISAALCINRNITAKYLTTLHRQGQVDLRSYGKVRLYQLCTRVPYHAFSLMCDGVALGIDRLGIIREISGPIETVLTCQKEGLIGIQLKDLNHPLLSYPDIQVQIQRLLEIRGTTPYRRTMIIDDRIYRIMMIACIYDDAMTGVGIQISDLSSFVVGSDISAPHLTQGLPLMYENEGFIVIMKPDERIQYSNVAYARYCAKPIQDIIEFSGLPFIRSQDMNRIREAYLRWAPGHDANSVEIIAVFPDGDIRWQQWTVLPSFKDKTLYEIHLHGKDVTEQKYQEMEIRELRRGISTIIDEKITDVRENARFMSQEIESRKREEKRLKNQIDLLMSLHSHHPVVIVESDMGGIITSATIPEEIAQVSEHLVIGLPLTDVLFVDEGSHKKKFIDYSMDQNHQFRKILCHMQIGSMMIPVTTSGIALKGQDGLFSGMSLVIEFSAGLRSI